MKVKTRDGIWFGALWIVTLLLFLSGCTAIPGATQQQARDATKEARDTSLYLQCRVRPIGSWFDYFSDRPSIAKLEWQACLLYNNQEEGPVIPECEQ